MKSMRIECRTYDPLCFETKSDLRVNNLRSHSYNLSYTTTLSFPHQLPHSHLRLLLPHKHTTRVRACVWYGRGGCTNVFIIQAAATSAILERREVHKKNVLANGAQKEQMLSASIVSTVSILNGITIGL